VTHVLIVEDSPTQAQALALLLVSEGFEVALARDGAAGMSRCQEGDIDLVLSDVVMPGIDGYELCRQLKLHEKTSGVPVILLTSLADPMDIVRGLECGADNFITKPYDGAYLIGRVRRLLDNKALRSQRKVSVGVDVLIMGKKFTVNSEKEQMLDLLVSTFEEVLRSRQREYDTKLREETMRESHRFLQAALDALSSQIAIVDEQGSIIAVNAGWRRFAQGWSWEKAGVGTDYLDVWQKAFAMDAEDSAPILDGIRAVHKGWQPVFSTEYAAHVHNELRWFALSATRFSDRGAHLVAVEHDDVTARKQLEQQFQHSQKMEAIGQLAGGVAHDFNNLLTIIGGYAQLLVADCAPDDARAEDLKEIIAAADTATALTRQLLAFSRKQVLQPKVLDINAAIADLEKMLRRLIGENISYVTVLDPNVGRVRADPSQIQQIVMNLVVNARDAMPRGGKLTVETGNAVLDASYAASHTGVTPGRYLMLAVTDNGTGMDAQTLARIFEPFFTTKGVGQGTGLGLSTVYGIVQQSGGHVWVYSEPCYGTTFKIYLPRVDDDVIELAQVGATHADLRPPSETLLVVEDHDAVRGMLCRILRSEGYSVLEAHGPGAARRISAEYGQPIDLLISDVVMPEQSGIDLAKELTVERPTMRVLLMSGYSGTAMAWQGELRGDMAFLEKPFNPDVVAAKVRAVLDRTAASARE
jgi:signal transduction histidine kinase/ActR/RegA family two-component response regulator